MHACSSVAVHGRITAKIRPRPDMWIDPWGRPPQGMRGRCQPLVQGARDHGGNQNLPGRDFRPTPTQSLAKRARLAAAGLRWRGQQTSRVLTMLAYCSDGAADATTVYEAAVCAARAAELAAVEAKAASEASCTLALATALRAAAEADARAETAEVRLGAAVQDATLAQRSLASERQLASRRAAAQQASIG